MQNKRYSNQQSKICYNGIYQENIYLTPAGVSVPFSNIHFWCPVFPYKIFSLFCFPCKWILIFPYITTVLVDFPVAVNITTFTKRVANTNEMSKACVMVMFYTHIKETLTFTMLINQQSSILSRSVANSGFNIIISFLIVYWYDESYQYQIEFHKYMVYCIQFICSPRCSCYHFSWRVITFIKIFISIYILHWYDSLHLTLWYVYLYSINRFNVWFG